MSTNNGGHAIAVTDGAKRNCTKCKSLIVVTAYMTRHRKYVCMPCQSASAASWARANREKKRAANNKWHAEHSARRAEATARWRESHPEKRIAHQAVQSALRSGRLIKEACGVCGSVTRIHGHHDDYSKPLDVIWLCHSHHMQRHAMIAARGDV